MNKQPDWLIKREINLHGHDITYSYDTESDILEIYFQKGGGVGVDLTDNIVLRFDRHSQQALSLILTSFSKLTRPTKFGPSSFPLNQLDELPPDMQQVVWSILDSFPVNCFLKVSGLFLTPGGELQPITLLQQPDELRLDLVLA